MAIVFRALEQRDVLKVLSLFQKLESERAQVSFTEVLDDSQIGLWVGNEQDFVYVAADGDLILGVVRARRENLDRPHAVVLTVAVDYQFRGQNIAKDLTLFCLDQIKSHGVEIARAYIYSDNYSSVCTILSCGFVAAGSIHRHHYDERQKRYVDDLIFHKVLGQ